MGRGVFVVTSFKLNWGFMYFLTCMGGCRFVYVNGLLMIDGKIFYKSICQRKVICTVLCRELKCQAGYASIPSNTNCHAPNAQLIVDIISFDDSRTRIRAQGFAVPTRKC